MTGKNPGSRINQGLALQQIYPDNQLWNRWLAAHPDPILGHAFWGASRLIDANPVALDSSFPHLPSGLAEDLIGDIPDLELPASHSDLLENNLRGLGNGQFRAVVTGQQPGYSGGPLYTLFKIATCVALAERLSTPGSRVVPVFWLGDDDDDWPEALSSLAWDFSSGELKSSELKASGGRRRRDMVGTLSVSPLERSTQDILQALVPDTGLGRDIAHLFQQSLRLEWNLSRLTQALLHRVFGSRGLVVLRGNDSRLHRHGVDFYNRVLPELETLKNAVEKRGLELAQKFAFTPLAGNSLQRPLYRVEGNKRLPWTPAETSGLDPSAWRCGVMLRSPLQDFLLNPVAVVVGPGELNYLSQLEPLYDILGIPRRPLLPRMFGWVVPEELDLDSLHSFSTRREISIATAGAWADEAGQVAREFLAGLMQEKLGVDEGRARLLADGRTRRWLKGVQAMLKDESGRLVEELRPAEPGWVFLPGGRQERKLGWVTLLAHFGQPMFEGVMSAAADHLNAGSNLQWNEFIIRVPGSDGPAPKG